jgi:Uma2 family endonuclease
MIVTLESPPINTLADLLDSLGGIPADRVRFNPKPGEATEQDAIEAEHRFGRLCELIDGTLVEKAMGYYESLLAVVIARVLSNFVSPRKLGLVAGSDGMHRVLPGQIREPDASYTSWARVPADYQTNAAPRVSPDLTIEILSPSNTVREMRRKRSDYFAGGTRLLWIVDPPTKTVAVYVSAEGEPVVLTENDALDGADVLPGFTFPIAQIFAEVQRPAV